MIFDDMFTLGGFLHEYYTTALPSIPILELTSVSVKKKDVFGKIYTITHRIIQQCIIQVTSIVSQLEIFNSKGSKSISEILEQSLNKLEKSSIKPLKRFTVTFRTSQDGILNESVGDSEDLTFTYDPKKAAKGLAVKIRNSGLQFKLAPLLVDDGLQEGNGQMGASIIGLILVYNFITDTRYGENLITCIKGIKGQAWDKNNADGTEFTAAARYISTMNSMPELDAEITIKQLLDFNKQLVKLHKALGELGYDDPMKVLVDGYDSAVRVLNEVAEIAKLLQEGINLITIGISNKYTVPPKYVESVSNIEDLSEFICLCIDGNIPSSVIAFAAYVVCNKTLRGSSDPYYPKMGQSRVCFFPFRGYGESYVLKIAINQMGIRANSSECLVYDEFKKNDYDILLAKILDRAKNRAVISMEKAETSIDAMIKQTDIDQLEKDINSACKACGLQVSIVDIRKDNVGRIGRRLVCIDYGYTERQDKRNP